MKRWISKYATHGLAASEAAAEALFGSAWRSDMRSRVLHCGIDVEPFRQAVSGEAVRQELGIPITTPVVGHVGRFTPQKNHPFLLDIAKEVIKARPEVWFLLVGDGPLRPRMEAKARALGIGKNVIFAGPRSDVARLMLGAMDVFLFPSLWEGLGLALVEAQAAGLRCLASDAVPQEATVVPNSVDFLPLSAGVSEWAAHVLRAANHQPVPRRTTLDALMQSSYGIETSCKNLGDLYEQVLISP